MMDRLRDCDLRSAGINKCHSMYFDENRGVNSVENGKIPRNRKFDNSERNTSENESDAGDSGTEDKISKSVRNLCSSKFKSATDASARAHESNNNVSCVDDNNRKRRLSGSNDYECYESVGKRVKSDSLKEQMFQVRA